MFIICRTKYGIIRGHHFTTPIYNIYRLSNKTEKYYFYGYINSRGQYSKSTSCTAHYNKDELTAPMTGNKYIDCEITDGKDLHHNIVLRCMEVQNDAFNT